MKKSSVQEGRQNQCDKIQSINQLITFSDTLCQLFVKEYISEVIGL